jgi:hypothetical protein
MPVGLSVIRHWPRGFAYLKSGRAEFHRAELRALSPLFWSHSRIGTFVPVTLVAQPAHNRSEMAQLV